MQEVDPPKRKIIFCNGIGVQKKERPIQEAIQAVGTFKKATAHFNISQENTQHLPGQKKQGYSQQSMADTLTFFMKKKKYGQQESLKDNNDLQQVINGNGQGIN